jgi:cobyrinic acid a,c-diamide synthase
VSAVVIAGTHSGAGKTSVTLGLIGALRRRGLTVQPFKVGPDFIDPLHHQHASGRPPRNLDGWMLDMKCNRDRFARAVADADVAVIEGVMGLFDGSEGGSDRGSTAEIARELGVPVVLVVDASAMARSAAAVIHGYATFDASVRIAGVILNNVGGAVHAKMIEEAVAGAVPILGALPRDPELVVPERHLGLHLPGEARAGYLDRLASLVAEHVDIDALLGAGSVSVGAPVPVVPGSSVSPAVARIGVARDEAFCFYYADNLELLRDAGADLIEFSPLADPVPRELDGLYVGGGYPELHAGALAAGPARDGVRELAASGAPVYAECGGLMYLAARLVVDGESHAMCGVLPVATRIPAGLTLSYVEITTTGGLFGAGRVARGHMFHHSSIDGGASSLDGCYRVRTSAGEESVEGFQAGSALASYAHLHFASNPGLASAFVERARSFASAH